MLSSPPQHAAAGAPGLPSVHHCAPKHFASPFRGALRPSGSPPRGLRPPNPPANGTVRQVPQRRSLRRLALLVLPLSDMLAQRTVDRCLVPTAMILKPTHHISIETNRHNLLHRLIDAANKTTGDQIWNVRIINIVIAHFIESLALCSGQFRSSIRIKFEPFGRALLHDDWPSLQRSSDTAR